MAQKPLTDSHRKQIKAGISGRKRGHKFERILTEKINKLIFSEFKPGINSTHIYQGNPACILLQYIANDMNITINSVKAFWLGGLATSGNGDILLDSEGRPVAKCKSDILLKLSTNEGFIEIGISVKTCNKKTPTNDQMFFTTATAFCRLLEENGIMISDESKKALSMFCGDINYRPIDLMSSIELEKRISDPNRYYWEELPSTARENWADIFNIYQDKISMILFQKAYKDDPYTPQYLLHQTSRYEDFEQCPLAIFSMAEIVECSKNYSNFNLADYIIHKGRYKNDNNIHQAPRFGFIQFQRGGQKQHPTQLQFNLKAGYFKSVN